MTFRNVCLSIPLTLAACGARGNAAEQQLLAHTWAPSAQSCGRDFLKFTPTALELHQPGHPSALQVLKITTAEGFPNAVMVVVGPNPPGSGGDVPEQARVGFVLEVLNGQLKLVGGGSPTHLRAASAEDPSVELFNRVACP